MGETIPKTHEDFLAAMEKKVCDCNECDIAPNRGFGYGNIRSKVMFIAQNPGWQPKSLSWEIIPFGLDKGGENSGKHFFRLLNDIGLTPFSSYVTNVIKCPTHGNRAPTEKEMINCIGFLKFEVALQRPQKIVLLGKIASKVFYRYIGDFCSERQLKPRTFHLWHPGYILRFPDKYDEWLNKAKRITE